METKGSENHQSADTKHIAGQEKSVTDTNVTIPKVSTGKDGNVSMDEHLERLAALNLSSTYATHSRFSPTIIRLISAVAGLAALLLIYFCFKLFV